MISAQATVYYEKDVLIINLLMNIIYFINKFSQRSNPTYNISGAKKKVVKMNGYQKKQKANTYSALHSYKDIP